MSRRGNRFKNTNKPKRQNKIRLKAEKENRKETKVWEKANGSRKHKGINEKKRTKNRN